MFANPTVIVVASAPCRTHVPSVEDACYDRGSTLWLTRLLSDRAPYSRSFRAALKKKSNMVFRKQKEKEDTLEILNLFRRAKHLEGFIYTFRQMEKKNNKWKNMKYRKLHEKQSWKYRNVWKLMVLIRMALRPNYFGYSSLC